MIADIKLSREGMIAALKSGPVAAHVTKAAQAVAGGARPVAHDGPAPVVVLPYEARMSAAAGVQINHPAGAAMEAKHAYLQRAARAAGLEIAEVLTYTTKSGKTRRATQAQIDNWTRGKR